MSQMRNAIMRMPMDRRIATNAGYTFNFKKDEDKFVPGIAVQEVRKHGGIIVNYADGSMDVPESANKMKVPSLVTSESSMPEGEGEGISVEAEERVTSTTDADDDDAVAQAVKDMDSFNQKEARMKNAIMKLISDNDPENFVATTGMPKVSAISTVMGGEQVTGEVRDLVWRKMESAGLIEVEHESDAE